MNSKDNTSLSAPNEEIRPTQLGQIKARYEEEREKRLRDDGNAQFIEAAKSAQYERFVDDPWVDPTAVQSLQAKFSNNRTEMLIIGDIESYIYLPYLEETGTYPSIVIRKAKRSAHMPILLCRNGD